MNETVLEPKQEVVKTNGHNPAPVKVLVPPTTPQKNRRWWVLATVIGAVALWAIVRAYRFAAVHESTDDAFVDGHIVSIAPKVAGTVTAVHIQDNQLVKAGDPLLEIDPRDYQAKVDEQRGKLAAAMAEAGRAQADERRYEEIYKQDEMREPPPLPH
jgi:membrane fusion protein (multidrug efflux system)